MICNCRRCGNHREYHKGRKTGGTTGQYHELRKRINTSHILKFDTEPFPRLCIDCMRELLLWLSKKDAHVQIKAKRILRRLLPRRRVLPQLKTAKS